MISRVINGRYEVLERVGEGTFFQVFKARDKVMGRMVAVKSLQSVHARDAAFSAAIRRAMTDAQALNHGNIARVYEVGEDDGRPFVVTEYVRGIDLKERIRRIAPFTLSVAVDFAICIAEAAQQGHADGVIHGDLRPQNVIVSPEGAVKVTDFGMARVLASSPQSAAANLGRAVHYQAPEIASGGAPSVASDVYAIGVILFEMLTGGLPYPGETPLIVAMKQQNEAVPSPRALNPGVPRSLEGIVMKALQKRPEDRYRTAGDLLTDLRAVRDALRFGKPLSWSPMEPERTGIRPAAAPVAAGAAAAAVPSGAPAAAKAAVAEPLGAAKMSSTAADDDTLHPVLRAALYVTGGVLATVLVVGVLLWVTTFSKPKDMAFPDIVGKDFGAAEQLVDPLGVKLIRHDEYNEHFPPNVIYRSELEKGRMVRASRTMVNVWVSKGSRMVWVPDVTKISKEDADQKLKDAGLTLGAVDLQYSNSVNYGYVISQNPKAGKHVERDLPVNIQVSEGPKPGDTSDTGTDVPDATVGGGSPSTPDTGVAPEPVDQDLKITVRGGGAGRRRVRVEYEDAAGVHVPIDEDHNAGDVIAQKVPVSGNKITLRIFYDDQIYSEQVLNVGRR